MRQANDYVENVETISIAATEYQQPLMCVGVVTVRQYVSITVESLLEGLDDGEREAVCLNVFIAYESVGVSYI